LLKVVVLSREDLGGIACLYNVPVGKTKEKLLARPKCRWEAQFYNYFKASDLQAGVHDTS
jgi:hypothetical protein